MNGTPHEVEHVDVLGDARDNVCYVNLEDVHGAKTCT